jgi:hypothetical protein
LQQALGGQNVVPKVMPELRAPTGPDTRPAGDVMSVGEKAFTEVGSNEARAACDQNPHLKEINICFNDDMLLEVLRLRSLESVWPCSQQVEQLRMRGHDQVAEGVLEEVRADDGGPISRLGLVTGAG